MSKRQIGKFEKIIINSDCYQISDEDELEGETFYSDQKTITNRRKSKSISKEIVHVRGPYERAWNADATRALIHIRGPKEDQFSGGKEQRSNLWMNITKELNKRGYRFSQAKIQKKWNNILITYQKNLLKKDENGQVHWEFFDEFHKYFQDKNGIYNDKTINDITVDAVDGGEESYQCQQTYNTESTEQVYEQPNNVSLPVNGATTPVTILDYDYIENIDLATRAKMNIKFNNHENKDVNNCNEKVPPVTPIENTQRTNGMMDLSNNLMIQNLTELPSPPLRPFDAYNYNNDNQNFTENNWWREYFDRKLQCEADKLQFQKQMHHELMNFNKMSLTQQEKIERIKIDAINNLTSTLQKLVETKNKK